MQMLAPFGFYGSGNIGDEASLTGFAELVRASGRDLAVAVASANPRHTAKIEPYFRYHKYKGGFVGIRSKLTGHRARAFVFPGGTPIMDGLGGWPLEALAPIIEYGHRWGKPAVFVGIGVERLARAESKAIVRDRIAPYVAHWTVRSTKDQQRLLDLNVPANRITVAADMAWLIRRANLDYGKQALRLHLETGHPLIGVNINAETSVLERAPQLFETLAAALDAMIEEHNARVIFLFNEIREGPTYDMAAAARVKSLMRRSDAAFATPNDYLSPLQMMSIIGNCALTISTRYHFCLFSALQGTPFLALKRSDKVSDLCVDLGWEYGAAVEAADSTALASQARTLFKEPKPALERLAARVNEMKARSQANFKGLDALQAAAAQAKRGDGLKRALGHAFGSKGDPA
jgi:polysaccharide pyruvyl transferase WcaK-like protein